MTVEEVEVIRQTISPVVESMERTIKRLTEAFEHINTLGRAIVRLDERIRALERARFNLPPPEAKQ